MTAAIAPAAIGLVMAAAWLATLVLLIVSPLHDHPNPTRPGRAERIRWRAANLLNRLLLLLHRLPDHPHPDADPEAQEWAGWRDTVPHIRALADAERTAELAWAPASPDHPERTNAP
jgi:hypothetical protein